MSDFNQDTVPKTLGGPGPLHNGGTHVPCDNTSMDFIVPAAAHGSQGFTGDLPESSPGQSDLGPSMEPDPVAQAHQAIFNQSTCALPPSLLAQQIAYNYPASSRLPIMATPQPPFPAPSPSATATAAAPDQATTPVAPPTRKPYRKTPLSELSAQEKEARQRLLASCNHDRELFLAFLKEPNHGGLAPERVAVLQRVFKHYTMSSFPGSASGIEANKKGRREGLAEIAHVKARMASGVYQSGIVNERSSGGVYGPESREGRSVSEENKLTRADGDGECKAEESSDDPTTAGSSSSTSKTFSAQAQDQERISDGITLSYSLNGKECTKDELDDARNRYYPRTIINQKPPRSSSSKSRSRRIYTITTRRLRVPSRCRVIKCKVARCRCSRCKASRCAYSRCISSRCSERVGGARRSIKEGNISRDIPLGSEPPLLFTLLPQTRSDRVLSSRVGIGSLFLGLGKVQRERFMVVGAY